MDIQLLLSELEKQIPSKKPAHHSLTLDDNGLVMLTLFPKEAKVYLPIYLDDADLLKEPTELVKEIVGIYKEKVAGIDIQREVSEC